MEKEKKSFIAKLNAFFKNYYMIIGEICAVIVAAATSVLGLLNFWDIQTVLSVFCALIAFMIVYFITQHKNLSAVQDNLNTKLDGLEQLVADASNPNLDSIMLQNQEASETEIIASAKSELYLVQETGNLIIERNKASLRDFLKNGGSLKIVVCSGEIMTQSLLALRNADLRLSKDIDYRLQNFVSQIQSVVERPKFGTVKNTLSKNVEIRYCPYPVAITAVYSPDAHIQAAVVRHADFRAPYDDKVALTVEADQFPGLYKHYQEQIELYRLFSYKKILITGQPHIGKTTLIKEILERVDTDELKPLYYAYTEDILQNGERIGYQLRTSVHPEPRQVAVRDESLSPLRYQINQELLETLAAELEENLDKVLVIDEVGIMQMQNPAFAKVINKIVNMRNCSLIGTVTYDSAGHHGIEQVKNNMMCQIVEYSRDNHDALLNDMASELSAALNVYSLLKTKE